MINNNKILLLFPDGVGIRNYLYSDVFKTMEDNLILFHAFDAKTEQAVKKLSNIENTIAIPKYNESVLEKFYRELICLARLKHNAKLVNNETLLANWKTNHKNFKNKLFYKSIALSSKFISNYNQILFLEKKYQKAIENNSFYHEVKDILERVKPSQIFCTHQRGVQCATIFKAAQNLGIKTTTVIYSWDNIPKARLALKADHYLVWSNHMKKELELFYPEIKLEKISVTGTPQFECYQDKNNIIQKKEFYNKYNLDQNKKTICFSGDDTKTSPDDPKYLNDLAEELINNGLENQYQILLRRCPVDVSGRFDAIIEKHKHIIKPAAPLWNFDASNSWTTIYPLREDIKLLVSTAFYCDVVVNVGSTMAFDFAMFNKPCIYINYNQQNQSNNNWSVNTIYNFQHFKSMPNRDCVIWWNKKNEIISILQNLKFSPSINTWKAIILSDYNNASNKINQILK